MRLVDQSGREWPVVRAADGLLHFHVDHHNVFVGLRANKFYPFAGGPAKVEPGDTLKASFHASQ